MQYPYKDLEKLTLPSLFEYAVKKYGKRDAFAVVGEKPFSYNDFELLVKKMSELFLVSGLKKGDKVILLSENMPNWGVAYFGVTSFGGVIVPVLPDFNPIDIHNIITHSEAKAVIVSSKYLHVIEQYEKKEDLLFAFNLESFTMEFSHIKESQEAIYEEVFEEDLASILYTSGTTGHSKGVMLSHKNLVSNATSIYNHIEVRSDDVWLSILPLAHVFECTAGMLIPILHGSSVYYLKKMPTPTILLDALQKVRPTMMLSVPLIIEKIYKNKILPSFTNSFLMKTLYSIPFIRKKLNQIAGEKLLQSFGGRIRFFAIGGAPLSPYVEQFLIEAKFPYIVGYGLSETSPLLTVVKRDGKIHFQSAGYPVANTQLKIQDKDEKTGIGEIVAKSPSVMMGYFKDPQKTAEVMEDGWFFTGDLGYIDKDGYLYIRGRSKNVIIGPSGENIYPEQLEAVINQKKGVVESLVIESDKKLIAKIHLDEEFVDNLVQKFPKEQQQRKIDEYLEKMRKEVNSEVASFSKISKFIAVDEPFVKTPTKKIKRYLHI
ncbi:Long-chain-fatty-acid--CoA ligase [hydrothermal vent metagenome]|uniref:Long-chain-fatty-acid--CoA ligase n=1 Tax=hydrothermal vent metagenome TaxID=652676 RepID=A0A1W1D4N0_9ZZZZ